MPTTYDYLNLDTEWLAIEKMQLYDAPRADSTHTGDLFHSGQVEADSTYKFNEVSERDEMGRAIQVGLTFEATIFILNNAIQLRKDLSAFIMKYPLPAVTIYLNNAAYCEQYGGTTIWEVLYFDSGEGEGIDPYDNRLGITYSEERVDTTRTRLKITLSGFIQNYSQVFL